MKSMYVRHKVADFNSWKKVFDDAEPIRKKYGSLGSDVFRNNSNQNEILIITYWNSKDDGEKYSHSPELKNAFKDGGVLTAPEVRFSE